MVSHKPIRRSRDVFCPGFLLLTIHQKPLEHVAAALVVVVVVTAPVAVVGVVVASVPVVVVVASVA